MEVDIQVDKHEGLVRVRIWGSLSDSDLLLGNELLADTAGFHSGLNQLVDITGVTVSSVTSKGLTLFTAAAPMFNPSSRRAIVVPSDLGFGLARMVELRRGGDAGNMAVFRDIAEAELWLKGNVSD